MEATRTYDDEVTREVPTAGPVVAAVADQCAACGGRLASDQRYCVNCGERRGKARFSLTSMAATQAEAPPPAHPARQRPGLSSSTTLITGIATLLLAMGVGVLIGRSGTNSSHQASSPAVQVITAGGSAGAATTAGGASSAAKASKAVKKAVITKQTAAKAQAAASKVIGGKNLPPPTVTVGQKGHGPGYKNGTFTGDYFGQ